MTLSKEEAEKAAKELVDLSLEQKELAAKIKTLKANLIEYSEVENLPNVAWPVDNGYVEIKTEVKYKLSEIPADVKIDANACPIDVAEKAFKSKIVLTKEGKQMLKEEYASIMRLMIPEDKKMINVMV